MTYMTAAGVVIGFLSLCGAIFGYIRSRLRERKIIIYELLTSVPFLRNRPGMTSADLSVRHNGQELSDPHLVEVQLTSKSRWDIPTSAFDQSRPFCLDVGAPIIALLETRYQPDQAPVPEITAVGSTLQIRPSLIRRRQGMRFSILTDGPGGRLTCMNPIIDYTVRDGQASQTRLVRDMPVRRILGWTVVIFLVYYVVTQPQGAAQALNTLTSPLRLAGQYLATFLNSL